MNSLFATQIESLVQEAQALAAKVERLPLPEQVEALNHIRLALHRVSPFASEPVDCVQWVAADSMEANDYNPNAVPPPEMKLLALSIGEDGYTQPVVGWRKGDKTEVVDGYHRTRIGKENTAVRRRIHGYLPVAYIKPSREGKNDRMAATIRHNRARGVHAVIPMVDIVVALRQLGWDDAKVAKELGMDADEVLRFKQTSGLADLFKEHPYSKAWE